MPDNPALPAQPQQGRPQADDEQVVRAWARSLNTTPERLREAMREGAEHADMVRELINMK